MRQQTGFPIVLSFFYGKTKNEIEHIAHDEIMKRASKIIFLQKDISAAKQEDNSNLPQHIFTSVLRQEVMYVVSSSPANVTTFRRFIGEIVIQHAKLIYLAYFKLFMASLFGNSVIIYIIRKGNNSMKTTTNYLVLNQAATMLDGFTK